MLTVFLCTQEIEKMNLTYEKILMERAARTKTPVNGSLELLPLCNMKCDMCYVRLSRAEMERKGSLYTADEWIRLGGEMVEAGVLFLLLTGGEPLLFPDFQRLYLELRKLGMILTVNTNGTLLDEKWADFFGRYKPRRVNITLYGADETAYRKLCHYPEGYEKAVCAIRLLKERGVGVKINGSVTRDNRADMYKIYQIGRDLDVPVHMDTYMFPGLHERRLPFDQQSRLGPEEAAAAEIEVKKAEMEPADFACYIQQTAERLRTAGQLFPRQISCMAGRCSFTVNWQGVMHPCVMLDEPEGSVFDCGFHAAWSEMSKNSGKFLLNEKCAGCTLRPVCHICAASAKMETGIYDGVPEYLCRFAKEYARLLCLEAETEKSKEEAYYI